MNVSVDELSTAVLECGLASQEELLALRRRHTPRDATEFAALLVEQKHLTDYQRTQIFERNTRSLILNDYVILEKLGQGGMGVVFKARHRRMDRIVALKTFLPDAAGTPRQMARFHREIKVLARLNHPNVVIVYDAGESDGINYFAMELISGTDLQKLVASQGVRSVEQAVEFVLQAAAGLAHAHDLGVIHRDIKLSNLIRDEKGVVKILDLGLASDAGPNSELSVGQAGVGTVDYMAPEQAQGLSNADVRSDVYSLGATLWQLLVGRPVYDGPTIYTKIYAHVSAPIPSLRAVRGDTPPELDRIFQKMLSKKPEDRHQSMQEVIAELRACVPRLAGVAQSIGAVERPLAGSMKQPSGAMADGGGRLDWGAQTMAGIGDPESPLKETASAMGADQPTLLQPLRTQAYAAASATGSPAGSKAARRAKSSPGRQGEPHPKESLMPWIVLGVLALLVFPGIAGYIAYSLTHVPPLDEAALVAGPPTSIQEEQAAPQASDKPPL